MDSSLIYNPAIIGLVILTILTIALFVKIIMMNNRLKKFLVDVDAKNIGDSLDHIAAKVKSLQSFEKEMESYLSSVEKRLRKSAQSIYTVRFNPFHGTGGGGNQSFATSILNEEGDGVVISSLYSREHVSIYSKPIKNFTSEHELSTEEKESVDKAKIGLK